jgi:DNA-binding SARP family transcriptional activator
MLSFQLFGVGQANYQGKPLSGFPQQRPSLLLCYLLLNRQLHHRERLAAVFWGDSYLRSARKQLRNTLWSLRQILQSVGAEPSEFLSIDEENVAFIQGSCYLLDVEKFEGTIRGYGHLDGHELSLDQAKELEAAADLYTGDLLEGVFEDWCLYDRERLRFMYLEILNKLLVFYAARGDYGRALGYCQRLLVLDRHQEKNHRQMMCLYWLSGDRMAALSHYKLLNQILRQELGISPLDETRNLYELMRNGQVRTDEWVLKRYLGSVSTSEKERMEIEPATVDHLISRLQQLQETIDATTAELHQIQSLFTRSLGDHRAP